MGFIAGLKRAARVCRSAQSFFNSASQTVNFEYTLIILSVVGAKTAQVNNNLKTLAL